VDALLNFDEDAKPGSEGQRRHGRATVSGHAG